ncbi:hypothetical protein ASPSYDRAFT_438252 [Aspergillus sydowii CBS 593.65]|uniref:Uncharacterized protein n=1 Tax=Aspergillus sydowii CBS 593.65 TaxID=1036612 RepID=A0A1L9T6E7_9EURO|nr:uncharacterized protein ASPSYDRAFT_438252 [Aspergillus sydowii CBS 593.65]OJJ55006.1 hypothetical protein ASPSYDRAFT_438252 [Aspergillus sydowii CBS 593.65]
MHYSILSRIHQRRKTLHHHSTGTELGLHLSWPSPRTIKRVIKHGPQLHSQGINAEWSNLISNLFQRRLQIGRLANWTYPLPRQTESSNGSNLVIVSCLVGQRILIRVRVTRPKLRTHIAGLQPKSLPC